MAGRTIRVLLVSLAIFFAAPSVCRAAGHPDKLHVLALLEGRSFAELDALLKGIQDRAEKDPEAEIDAQLAFDTFATSRPGVDKLLAEWKKARPGSYAADVAAANFFEHRGWEKRGGKYAAETSKEQFDAMRAEFADAVQRIVASLSQHPTSEGYATAIYITMAMGDHDRERQIAQRGLIQFPASFRIRRAHMQAMLPRWGGSYEEMQRFADESQKYAAQNPRLRGLLGLVAWDMGDRAVLTKNYGVGAELFTKAIAVGGEYWLFYSSRADVYVRMKENEKALGDANQALELYPQYPPTLADRAWALGRLGEIGQAAKDVSLAASLDPANKDVKAAGDTVASKLVSEAFEAERAGRDTEGIAMLDQALSVAPDRAETLYWRGQAHLRRSRLDPAEKDFREAIRLNPKYFDACRALDDLIARKGQWDEILTMWNRFLELDPDNAAAYLERAGTHKNKGEMDAASADLKKACDLGNTNGCRILESLGGKRN